jgi:uncharacterized damage-inducible protein DinB
VSKSADQVLAELRGSRTALLAAFEPFAEARFHERPASGGWSAADVAEHLVRVETRIVGGARRTVETGKGATPAPWDALLKLPLALGMIDGIRVRTVKGADPMDDEAVRGFTRAQLLERLAATRAQTEAFLHETRDRDLRGLWLKHPFLGCFGVREFVAWAGWHEARHVRQVGRIARALRVHSTK